MPNRAVHVLTSGLVGGAYAFKQAGSQAGPAAALETLGGLGGGYLGGRLPDLLDPPDCPNHRARAHSLLVGGVLIDLCQGQLEAWQRTCRDWAEKLTARKAAAAPGSPEAFLLGVAEVACRLLAGFLAGLLAGYLTHLGLDALTPASLNVI